MNRIYSIIFISNNPLFVESNWNFIFSSHRVFAFRLKRVKKCDVEFNEIFKQYIYTDFKYKYMCSTKSLQSRFFFFFVISQ